MTSTSAEKARPNAQVGAAVAAIQGALGVDATVGIYLFGSAVAGGLRADSDLDVLVLISRPMEREEKAQLTERLRPISRRSLRPSGWRPLEVTVVNQGDVRPWRYPPRFELQYGEWLTDAELEIQLDVDPTANPDLAVLIAMVRAMGRPLVGSPPDRTLDPVPPEDLVRAIHEAIPALLADLEDDTRNVLLTLARAWATVATGEILSKDAAVDWALSRLPTARRGPLKLARDLYVGGGHGDWHDELDTTRRLAEAMAAEVRGLARSIPPVRS